MSSSSKSSPPILKRFRDFNRFGARPQPLTQGTQRDELHQIALKILRWCKCRDEWIAHGVCKVKCIANFTRRQLRRAWSPMGVSPHKSVCVCA